MQDQSKPSKTAKPNEPPVIILTGPTGSGKSGLGLKIAKALGGEIINSDSMQIYKEIPTISFSPRETEGVNHQMYQFISCREPFSVFNFLIEASKSIHQTTSRGAIPIIVGGTPLYQRIMIDGLSKTPTVPAEISALAREKLAKIGPNGLYEELINADPSLLGRVMPRDEYRLIRAFEILHTTGASPTQMGNLPKIRILDGHKVIKLCLLPPRETVKASCSSRIEQMDQEAALQEAEGVRAMNLPKESSAARAIGLQEIIQHLEGHTSLEEALRAMELHTHQYAKRQYTWFNNKYKDFHFLTSDSLQDAMKIINQEL